VRFPRQLLLLLLTLGLGLLAVAQIASADGEVEASSAAREPTIELSEEVELEEECLEAEDEAESEGEADEPEEAEEEECEFDAGKSSRLGSEDCVLRTAHARVVAFPERNQMRLTLGYTTSAPTRATVEYLAHVGERLGGTTRSLGRGGVLRLSRHVGRGQMARLRNSHRITVTVNIPEVPERCERLETLHLARRHSSDARVTWSQVG